MTGAKPIGPFAAKFDKSTKGMELSVVAEVQARRVGDQTKFAFSPGTIETPSWVNGTEPVFRTVKVFTFVGSVGAGRVKAIPAVVCGICAASAISTVSGAKPICPFAAKFDKSTKGIEVSIVVGITHCPREGDHTNSE